VREEIEFWRAVEMFSPQSVPGLGDEGVYDLEPGSPLPWSAAHPVHKKSTKKHPFWRYTIYAGIFPTNEAFKALEEDFPPPPEGYEERRSDTAAMLAFTVSEGGFLLEGSVVLSGCVWAMGRALNLSKSSRRWLDGFGGDEAAFRTAMEDCYLPVEDGRRRQVFLDWDALVHFREAAVDALDIRGVLDAPDFRVRCENVGDRGAEAVDHDFLNSFIAEDLGQVARATERGAIGAALRGYLTPVDKLDLSRRIDVRTRLEEVRRATDPDRVPLGRWPADPERPLALGQQLAVNDATAMGRGGDPLFAVNGPPGTGKTTMLRDLVAALVTERADRLVELKVPAEAFVGGEPYEWESRKGHSRTLRRLDPKLTGFEMVVASSNNGAVENVTSELPSASAIDPFWRDRARDRDDLRVLAELAMGKGGSGVPPPAEEAAWALIAGRLGKSQRRQEFVDAVWWAPILGGKDRAGKESPSRLIDLLDKWRRQPRDPLPWRESVKAFEEARGRAAALRDERRKVSEALDRLGDLPAELEMAREVERVAREAVLVSRESRAELTASSHEYEEERRTLCHERDEDRRPFVLRFLARSAWQARGRHYAAEIATKEERLEEIEGELAELDGDEVNYEAACAGVESLVAEEEKCLRLVEAYREKPGAILPDAEWFGRDAEARDRRERRAPWSDVEWNAARTELFLAALDLHRAFLVGAAGEMRQALFATMEVISGGTSDLEPGAVLTAWQVLFLVVPVISTTFSSLGRLFDRLGPESLGWLLVDEAGQATPQSALGGLWRCRRAVIVGDPLQLEPITTIPVQVEEGMRVHFGIEEEWVTRNVSVQSRADRLNSFGTRLDGSDRAVWVGAPLTVHRRCDHPMFDISNEIAYDGLMVDATDRELAQKFAAEFRKLPPSKWIDVPTESSVGHWVPAETEKLDQVLGSLDEMELDFERVMAIGPFRDVARRLEEFKPRYRGLTAGTIHTAQGKEADIVILVLGSDPKAERARRWAASKPNLLNVAVSRARRRLYVIGDRERWKELPYFSVLDAELPTPRADKGPA
jgi:hypothetical protein